MYDVFVPCGFHCILLVIPFCDSYTVTNYLPFHCCRICYIISSQLYHATYEDAVLCLFCFSPVSSITLCPHFSLLHSSNFFTCVKHVYELRKMYALVQTSFI